MHTNPTHDSPSATRRTLLGLWAHPDDEAYLSAGLMHEYIRNGDHVVVVTATAGELGTDDPDTWPSTRLAAHRKRELADSLAAIGVSEHYVLDYADGGCAGVDGTDAFAAYIVAVDPDVIVTFGPDGMTGHPDHVAISQWATAAWERTGARSELWYATLTPDFHRRWARLNADVGLFAEQPLPPSTPHHELADLVVLDDEGRNAKFAALRAHRSQTAALIDLVGEDTYRDWWCMEAFRPATATRRHPLDERRLQDARR
jgi:LmbE family N-acetylglucosaminyl deacetylase